MHPDSEKSGGFFSKVLGMVRGNADAAAASGAADPDSLSAREVLQEAVGRKRRNEAIRQQEFAQLRLLRQRSEATEGGLTAHSPREDALASMLGQETRSTETLQKIDAIEAQMSGQWWQQSGQGLAKGDKPGAPRTLNPQQLRNLPVLGEDAVVHPAKHGLVASAGASLSPSVVPPATLHGAPAVPVFQAHPDLEEASILFAHGDIDGARTRLLEQLVQALSSAPVDEEKVGYLWHAVLDLCRATGDEEAFEPLAIDYAEHFGRSAPLWSSIPARLGIPALCGAPKPSATKRRFQWSCPSMLTVGAVTALRAAHEGAPQPWSMSWLRLSSIDEAALPQLTQLLDTWANSQGQFVLSDAGKLLQVVAQQTPEADNTRSTQWWALRMALLRLMNRMEDYEQVALDYCITYEVSPPSWVEPQCHCVVQEEGEADVSVLQEASRHSQHAPGAGGVPQPLDRSKGLAGVIEGDPQEWLDALASQAKPGQVLDIACDNLIRIDFVAAGTILNWASEMQSQGHNLRFTQLHQLVAVFFHIIGIHEHASVQASLA